MDLPDIGIMVRVFANGHTKDSKNDTWYYLA